MDIQHIAVPVAGKDYPRNWSEFLDWFANEQACLAYLQKLRWPDGFVCPACGVVGEPVPLESCTADVSRLRTPGFSDRWNQSSTRRAHRCEFGWRRPGT